MKKYLFTILCAMSLTLIPSACSSDIDNPYATTNGIKIVKSNILFDAPASEESIEVESNSPIHVECTASWCTVKVGNHVFLVTTSPNSSLDGRSTILTISNKENSIKATVQQQCMRFKVACPVMK